MFSTTLKLSSLLGICLLTSSAMFVPNEDSIRVQDQQNEMKLPQGLRVIEGNFTYGCPNSQFIPHEYATVDKKTIDLLCYLVDEGLTYVIGGGAVMKKTNGECTVDRNYTGIPDMNLCGRWSLRSLQMVGRQEACPAGHSLAAAYDMWNEEALDEVICPFAYKNFPNENGNTLTGNHGKLVHAVSPYHFCTWVSDAEDYEITTHKLCTHPEIIGVQPMEASSEKVCGENQSLVTGDEIRANRRAIAGFLRKRFPDDGQEYRMYLRIAGGASAALMQTGSGPGHFYDWIKVAENVWGNYNYALCADANR